MSTRSLCCCFIGLVLCSPAALAQTTWTVDDDGPADFNDLQLAVDSATRGDVLLIAPGNYGSVVVEQRLALIGTPAGDERVQLDFLHARNTEATRLLALDVDYLLLADLEGPSYLEEVRTREGAVFHDVGSAFASRCVFDQSEWGGVYVGPAGASVTADSGGHCHVEFVDCVLSGGTGWAQDLSPGVGGTGLEVEWGSALVSGCQLEGGFGTEGIKFQDGVPGPGLKVFQGSVEVRGSAEHAVVGAFQSGFWGSQQANAVQLSFNGQASLSGVSLVGPVTEGTQLNGSRPWLRAQRTPGQATLELFGPAGDPAFWVVAGQPDFDESFLPDFGLPLTLDFDTAIATGLVTLGGSDLPTPVDLALPAHPNFAGFVLPVQAVAVELQSGQARLTNGDALLLGS